LIINGLIVQPVMRGLYAASHCFPFLSELMTEEREQSTGDRLGLRQSAQVEQLFSFVAPFSRLRDQCGTEAR